MENNKYKRVIKPFIFSINNLIFSNIAKDSKSGNLIYIIIENAKANGLVYLFNVLANAESKDKETLG